MVKRTHKLADGASVTEHARRLRQRAGWDPEAVKGRQSERLQETLDELHCQQTFEDTEVCEACALLRDERQDPEALCQAHLAQALGFTSS